MRNRNLIGIVIAFLLFAIGFTIHGNIGLYFNLAGIFIVVGGTLVAALVCYRVERLLVVIRVVIESYQTKPKEPREIVEVLVDLAVKSKMAGLLSLEKDEQESSMLFLRESLGILIDGYNGREIRDYLSAEMNFFRLRRENIEQILRNIADFCPAFGLVGSVVGLIGMLGGVGDTSVILSTVPIALTSTLYGILLANFFFIPFAVNLRERTRRELLLQKIIMEGVIAIESELNPNLLERKLKSFLTPAMREGRMVSIEKIKKRFSIETSPMPPTSEVALKQESVEG